METKKILITGGAGYIGSHAARQIIASGYDVTIFDNFEGAGSNIQDKLKAEFVKGDLRNPEGLKNLEKYTFDACLHFAAYTSVGDSVNNPEKYFQNNVAGSFNLLSSLVNSGCKNFIFSSTSEVYGEAKYLPLDEFHELHPLNPYGLSKRMVEQNLEWLSRSGKLKFVALRYFNAAGCSFDGVLGEDHSPETHLIPNIVLGALGRKEFKLTCSIVDTPDKTPIRDYVHVEDLADAHVRALKYLLEGGESDYINLGSGSGYSVLEVVEVTEKVMGVPVGKSYGESRAGEPAKKYASNEKAKRILGWVPKYGLEDMVKTTFEYLKKVS